MVTLALTVGVCGARAATLNMTQRISRIFLHRKNEMDIGDALLVSELVEHFFKVNHPYFYLTYQVTTLILLTVMILSYWLV
ncbi:unnamed protein product [Brassica rapa subsp. narinosa]